MSSRSNPPGREDVLDVIGKLVSRIAVLESSIHEAFEHNRTVVADTNYVAVLGDQLIAFTLLTTGRTLTLPLSSEANVGQRYVIKDEHGSASIHNITIACSGGQTIDGVSTKTISSNYGVLSIYSTGSGWMTN